MRFILLFLLFILPLSGQYRDQIVAVVDKEPILLSDVESAFQLYSLQFPDMTEEEKNELKQKILNELVIQHLLVIQAKKDTTIQITEGEVEKALEQQIDQMKKQMGEENFNLELEREGLTLETLKDRYRNDFKNNLYMQKYVAMKIRPQVVVSPDEVKKFYENEKDSLPRMEEGFELSHILVRIKPGADKIKSAREKIDRVYQKLKAGADFGYMALKYSDDRQSAQMYGEIGYVQKGVLPPPVEEKIFSLKSGEFTEPIEGDYGFFIFKCMEKKGNEVRLAQIVTGAIPDKNDSLKALRIAQEARDYAIEKGFESAVKKYSDDPVSREKEGNLGFVSVKQLDESWRKKLKELKEGELSKPILGPMGYHIFKLISYQKGGFPSFSEIQEDIRNLLIQRKIQKEIDKIVQKLKEEVFVEIKYSFEG